MSRLCSCLMCWTPQSGTSSARLQIQARSKRHLHTVYAGKMRLGHPSACTFPKSPCAVHPTNSFPLPLLASSLPRYHTAALSTGIPARWGCSLATAALECFISTPCSSSLFPLVTSLGQTTALQFCLSNTGEASEETCNSLSRRLLLHLALSSGRRYPMNHSGKAKGAQRVLSSGFEQAAAHSWI